jgi:hypothetical protein
MPDVITTCGRAFEYPYQLEQLLGGLRYRGDAFLVSDLEEWRESPPPAQTVRLIVETLAGAMRLPYRVGMKPILEGRCSPAFTGSSAGRASQRTVVSESCERLTGSPRLPPNTVGRASRRARGGNIRRHLRAWSSTFGNGEGARPGYAAPDQDPHSTKRAD